MRGILISGYYGFGNSGDDALLLSIISDFKNNGFGDKITVLSANPAETKKVYGVKAVNRINPFSLLWEMLTCRLFISGGGTLIQDGTSTKSLLYYLGLIKIADIMGKKVMLYANGIGPIFKESNKKKCKKVLNSVDSITVRDEKSFKFLKELGVSKPEIKLTADPVFLLKPEGDISKIADKVSGEFFCVSVRETAGMDKTFVASVSNALDKICDKYNMTAVILSMQETDDEIGKQIAEKMNHNSVYIPCSLAPCEIMELVSKSCMCIGMRLHMLIYAAAVAVPLVGIVYDPKVSGFMEYANQNLFVDVKDVNETGLFELADKCLENRTKIKKDLICVKERLSALAAENSKLAINLYNSK